MNDNAKKWVAALRSGEWKQGRNYLRNLSDEFCCLGVLCELAVRDGATPPPVVVRGGVCGGKYYEYEDGARSGILQAVAEWAGMPCGLGEYRDGGVGKALAADNDLGKSFTEIADIIESEPEGLFTSGGAE